MEDLGHCVGPHEDSPAHNRRLLWLTVAILVLRATDPVPGNDSAADADTVTRELLPGRIVTIKPARQNSSPSRQRATRSGAVPISLDTGQAGGDR